MKKIIPRKRLNETEKEPEASSFFDKSKSSQGTDDNSYQYEKKESCRFFISKWCRRFFSVKPQKRVGDDCEVLIFTSKITHK